MSELRIVDLDEKVSGEVGEPGLPGRITIAVAHQQPAVDSWADDLMTSATMTLTEEPTTDPRCITVPSVAAALRELDTNVAAHPVAAHVCCDVLSAGSVLNGALAGLVTESLAYSTLQAGADFARWSDEHGPGRRSDCVDPVLLERTDDHLRIAFNQPARHNAFSNVLRAGLIDGLQVALADSSITLVELSGQGRSFCSGGDLSEFATFRDPASAHLARTRYSPALLIDQLAERLGEALVARVHGAVLGSGLEMAAFFGRVSADPGAYFGLPELGLGLIPGAGGTVSIPRRIGRWRTAYLILSGTQIDTTTALDWGLIDEIAARESRLNPMAANGPQAARCSSASLLAGSRNSSK